jgi:putative ABC transport system ATP-binding protein
MYKLTSVTKLYRKGRRTVPAVRDLNLTIEDGEWLAVQGRTGSGKSTLLNTLGGLDRPTEGTVELDGADLGALPEAQLTRLRAESIGFVFQTFNLVPTRSAAENVEAALIPLGIGHTGRRRRVAAALEQVGLADRASHLPSELSGGQQQRVAIARALVKGPKVLLADEPTGNLDEDTRDGIILLLERLWREEGITLVVITHDTSVAGRARSIGVMNKGRLTIRQAADPAVRHTRGRPLGDRRKRKRKGSTRPGRGRWRAPDLVKRKFAADGINRRWCGDGTEIATGEGKLYLDSVLDMGSL